MEEAESERPCRSDRRLGERMALLGVGTTVGETAKKFCMKKVMKNNFYKNTKIIIIIHKHGALHNYY